MPDPGEAEREAERRADNPEPPVSPLADAVEMYRARFGDTPWMIHIPADRMPAWLEAIREAARTGRPLEEADLRRVVGFGYPPPGACS